MFLRRIIIWGSYQYDIKGYYGMNGIMCMEKEETRNGSSTYGA